MVKYICDVCQKNFKQKSHFTQHKARKNPCKQPDFFLNNLNVGKYPNRKCNINFQTQFAYLNNNIAHLNNDKYICIDDYIKNKDLQNKNIYCQNGHELVCAQGDIRKSYFRHKNKGDMGGQPMSEWHAEWQGHFPITEHRCLKRTNQIKERRADAFIKDCHNVIEFQHSKITKNEVCDRKKDYALHNLKVIWIIDGNNTILEKPLEHSKRVYLEFISCFWKFGAFLDYDFVYIDINSKIYKVFPNKIKSNMIDVQQPKPKKDFIDSLKKGVDIWDPEEPPQSHLYLKQQGPGSGKTWWIIQMLEKDEFKHYTNFIIVTKQHTAKYVIFNEFKYQIATNQIRYLTDIKENNTQKHFVITYKNEKTNKQCKIIIATIDSLMYCLGNKEKNGFDKFETLVNSIIDGHITAAKNGTIRFARTQTLLNKETMLVLDETQDLPENYAKAIIQIMRDRYIDVYAVADKLQSIFVGDNTFTYFEKKDFSYTKKTPYPSQNIVRRFIHPKLIRFINYMIPYTDYELPVMEPYAEEEEIGDPLKMILGKSIKMGNENDEENKINREVGIIMEYFKKEVTKNNRVPEDFLIVTPFVKKNPLVDALQLAINQFWIKLFENPNEYFKQHSYWKDHLDTDIYNRYAIFHKSEEGKSIDLSESKHATRLVSIHASKGDGRPIVFVIGFSENALKKFSGEAGNMIYDSLLHVGMTRMKEKLFVRIEDNGDDISRKVMKFFEAEGLEIPLSPNLSISHKSKYNELIDYFGHMKKYEEINNIIIEPAKLAPIDDNTDDKQIIDMQHHTIRFSALFINLCLEIVRKEKNNHNDDIRSQIAAILHCCKDADVISSSNWREHNKLLASNLDEQKKTIPIFEMSKKGRDYKKYLKIIKTFVKNIQKKN